MEKNVIDVDSQSKIFIPLTIMRPKMVGLMLCTMLLFTATVGFGSDGAQTNKDPINIENVDVFDFHFSVPAAEEMNLPAITIDLPSNEVAFCPVADAPDVGVSILGNSSYSYFTSISKNPFTSYIGNSNDRHSSMSLCEKPKHTRLYRHSRE